MLLRNPHIKKPCWIHIAKPLQPCSVGHGRCNCNYFFVPGSQFRHNSRKNIGIVGRRPRFGRKTRFYIERVCTMESGRMTLGRKKSFPFFCNGMNQHCIFTTLRFPDDFHHRFHIVSVHRSQISNSHILKEHSRYHKMFYTAFGPADIPDNLFPFRHILQGIEHAFL